MVRDQDVSLQMYFTSQSDGWKALCLCDSRGRSLKHHQLVGKEWNFLCLYLAKNKTEVATQMVIHNIPTDSTGLSLFTQTMHLTPALLTEELLSCMMWSTVGFQLFHYMEDEEKWSWLDSEEQRSHHKKPELACGIRHFLTIRLQREWGGGEHWLTNKLSFQLQPQHARPFQQLFWLLAISPGKKLPLG